MHASKLFALLSLGLTLGILAASQLESAQSHVSPSLVSVHQVLAAFVLRGQLVVETFPPLSYLLTQVKPATRTIATDCAFVMSGSAIVLLLWYRLHSSRLVPAAVLACPVAISTVWWSWQPTEQPLEVSVHLGENILLVAVVILCYDKTLPGCIVSALMTVGVPEVLITCAVCLGVQRIDALATFCILLERIASTFLARLGDPSIPIGKVLFCFTMSVTWSVLIIAFTTVSVFTVVFPLSETSYGGNYNLHYLSPHFCRLLRPLVPEIAQIVQHHAGPFLSSGQAFPPYALLPGIPMTMYVPKAGFLWTDNLVWDPKEHTFREDVDVWNDEEASKETLESSLHYRVLFMDEVKWTTPWFFQNVVEPGSPDLGDNTHAGYLQPYQSVYFLDHRSNYLTVANSTTQLEQYLRIDSDKEQFWRNLVHTSSEKNIDGLWWLLYDPEKDSGFRLYHPDAQCFLATTYRQIPHWGERVANHSVSEQLHIEIELSCSSSPNKEASTFWPIDGFFPQRAETSCKWPIASGMWERIIATKEILWAMYKLKELRSLYSGLQDAPVGLRDDPGNIRMEPLARGILTVLLIATFTLELYRHRYGVRSGKSSIPDLGNISSARTRYRVGGGLCLVYLYFQSVFGMAYSTRWIVSFALIVGSDLMDAIYSDLHRS
ncbi:hypothetical protein PHISCL_01021 [Aspergillus sclerotialis]|uniref:Uncharacterized protein n=1 Tax=Aspergillus sclerotialis TaxID=2070753 RepID=A0A3A2ZZ01_9EURO|nr:hypothetical protein PHISCL_01021 [Aspergillus sclerotialis]